MKGSFHIKKLLSFDQASIKTGYAYFEDGNLKKFGVLKVNGNDSTEQRVYDMSLLIKECIEKYDPDKIVIEDVQNQCNVAIVKMLARLQGIIIGICFNRGISCKIMVPAEWRKVLNFTQGKTKRAELKRQSIEFVLSHYNSALQNRIITDDESDAVCIGCAFLKKFT